MTVLCTMRDPIWCSNRRAKRRACRIFHYRPFRMQVANADTLSLFFLVLSGGWGADLNDPLWCRAVGSILNAHVCQRVATRQPLSPPAHSIHR